MSHEPGSPSKTQRDGGLRGHKIECVPGHCVQGQGAGKATKLSDQPGRVMALSDGVLWLKCQFGDDLVFPSLPSCLVCSCLVYSCHILLYQLDVISSFNLQINFFHLHFHSSSPLLHPSLIHWRQVHASRRPHRPGSLSSPSGLAFFFGNV